MPSPEIERAADRNPRTFGDPHPKPTATAFRLDEAGLSAEDEELLEPIPPPRTSPPRMALADVIGTAATEAITQNGKIVFHSVGDTGGTESKTTAHQDSVVELMTKDLGTADPSPAFLFHLGDVVYYFGEDSKYYEEFYDPFREYDRPIFAIPGNHDAVVRDLRHKETSEEETLVGFKANFCTPTPEPSRDAGAVKRETMDQPGVYFTLDAPFVSIIGLFTNVLEGPGVIASEKLGEAQVEFLTAELERLKPEREAKERAVIIACHHPPASNDKQHGGGKKLTEDLDRAFNSSGLVPDAVLSGHAHLYQHWHREIGGRDIPYIVAGGGGYRLGKFHGAAPLEWDGFKLDVNPIVDYGYLLLTVDMTQSPPMLTIEFKQATPGAAGETVEVPLS
jgi:3',5'-cyclic AMP phosphodiesterase CpdA